MLLDIGIRFQTIPQLQSSTVRFEKLDSFEYENLKTNVGGGEGICSPMIRRTYFFALKNTDTSLEESVRSVCFLDWNEVNRPPKVLYRVESFIFYKMSSVEG